MEEKRGANLYRVAQKKKKEIIKTQRGGKGAVFIIT